MAYAKFFDGAIEVEGGKLHDRYTAGDDDIGQAWNGVMGARLVIHPIDSLYITFMGSDLNPAYYDYYEDYVKGKKISEKNWRRQGNPKFDQNLFSATARFEHDAFAIVGGAHFSGLFYGSFALKAVENLNFAVGFDADYSTHYEKGDGYYIDDNGNLKKADKDHKAKYYVYGESDDDKTHYLTADVVVEYDADPVLFGVIGYLNIAKDEWFIAKEGERWLSTVNPYVQYKLSDIVALRAESTLYLPAQWDEDKYGDRLDMYTTVTPSVVFNASKKAEVNVWLTVSSDTEQEHHATGVGVRYNF